MREAAGTSRGPSGLEGGRVVAGPLLDSKTRIPAGRPGAVPRPRLTGALAAAPRSALTLLSAPAGFGKTTLLTEWLAAAPAADGPDVAWLSLDAARQRPVAVLDLRRRRAADGGARRSAVRARRCCSRASRRPRRVLTDAAQRPRATCRATCVLVLDDYHVIEAARGARRDGVPARPPARRSCTW